MKQICTLFAIACALLITSNTFAQNSVAVNTSFPSPAPDPDFTTTDSVKLTNGFTSNSTGTFNNFPKNKTTTITSPSYFYTSTQSTIYFVYNIAVATAGSTTTAPQISIITPDGTFPATASMVTFSGVAGVNYYFTFSLATPLPAYTNFKIAMTMSVDNNDKTVQAFTLTTNAVRGTAPAGAFIPMPVTFSGFYAKQASNGVLLTWNVGTEQNVNGYEIQKSIDGASFSKIGFVAATNQNTYSFHDEAVAGSVYYRIKSIDNNGKFLYSSVISLKAEQSSVVLKAFPSPVQNQLTVQHNLVNGQSKIEVVAIDGKLVTSTNVNANSQQTTIDLSATKAGIYFVRFISQNTVTSLKVIKQ